MLLELLPWATEEAYNELLWDLVVYGVTDWSLVKTLMEHRMPSTVFVPHHRGAARQAQYAHG